MVILAKVQGGELYLDLRRQGFQSGHVVDCPHCDCQYRVFYGPEDVPVPLTRAEAATPSLDVMVERLHPGHHEDRLRVAPPSYKARNESVGIWNQISTSEVNLTEEAIQKLSGVSWATPLLKNLDPTEETSYQNRALLFEIRFAYALYQAGHTARYECAGLNSSTIDFCLATRDYEWRIELVSIFEGDAVQDATEQVGPFQQLVLSEKMGFDQGILDTPTSEAGEMIKAEEKISEKVFSKGKCTKFPEPAAGVIHVILTDMRGYLGIGKHVIDNYDYVQIAHGPAKVPDPYVQWWNNQPIKGLFQTDNPTKAAKYIRERVHMLAFVCERHYRDTEICSTVFCAPNPNLFSPVEQAREVLNQCPVRICAFPRGA